MKAKKGLTITKIYRSTKGGLQELPLFTARISAGFPSPADDYIDRKLDLNDYLIKHPAATFFVRVDGDSMINAGIHSGDILIVDRAIEPADNKIVIAVLYGELTVKRIKKTKTKLVLLPENPAFKPIEVTPEMGLEVWGVVTHVIHNL
jgi:DNA polymerase V